MNAQFSKVTWYEIGSILIYIQQKTILRAKRLPQHAFCLKEYSVLDSCQSCSSGTVHLQNHHLAQIQTHLWVNNGTNKSFEKKFFLSIK